jgi:hypothetical protein
MVPFETQLALGGLAVVALFVAPVPGPALALTPVPGPRAEHRAGPERRGRSRGRSLAASANPCLRRRHSRRTRRPSTSFHGDFAAMTASTSSGVRVSTSTFHSIA